MGHLGSSSARAAILAAGCCLAAGVAAAADPPRLCFDTGGGNVLELGISRARLGRPGYGLLAGRTFGPDEHVSCSGPRPLPLSGSYTTDSRGRVLITVTQRVVNGPSCGSGGFPIVYGFSLRAPSLRGTVCVNDFDATGCGPVRLLAACPPPP